MVDSAQNTTNTVCASHVVHHSPVASPCLCGSCCSCHFTSAKVCITASHVGHHSPAASPEVYASHVVHSSIASPEVYASHVAHSSVVSPEVCGDGGFFLTCEDFGRMFDHSFPVSTSFFFFFTWRLARTY